MASGGGWLQFLHVNQIKNCATIKDSHFEKYELRRYGKYLEIIIEERIKIWTNMIEIVKTHSIWTKIGRENELSGEELCYFLSIIV